MPHVHLPFHHHHHHHKDSACQHESANTADPATRSSQEISSEDGQSVYSAFKNKRSSWHSMYHKFSFHRTEDCPKGVHAISRESCEKWLTTQLEGKIADGPLPIATQSQEGKQQKSIEDIASHFRGRIYHFTDDARVLLKALDIVAKIHPYIDLALLAFKGVIELELKRQENNQKVLTLCISMMDMLAVLDHLNGVSPSQELQDAEESGIRGKLASLLQDISRDITECGNACDAYVKKRMIVRILKSYFYEQTLAEFAERFEMRRRQLSLLLDVKNSEDLDRTRGAIYESTQMMRELLVRLDTTRELEARAFIKHHGGAGHCEKDEDALESLLHMEGDMIIMVGSKTERRMTLSSLKMELCGDLEKGLKENMEQYEWKLTKAKDEIVKALQNIEDSIIQESANVVAKLREGPHERIDDMEIKTLWQEMHWRNSVKSQYFTLALRDHLIERLHGVYGGRRIHPVRGNTVIPDPYDEGSSSLHTWGQAHATDGAAFAASESAKNKNTIRSDEQWAIDALTMLTVQPITEALDDDGTGYVSTWEVNAFTSSRPDDWSLMRWLIYWGEGHRLAILLSSPPVDIVIGWYSSLLHYRTKILRTMQKMHELLDDLHPVNRETVDFYLNRAAFRRIELLMRGLDVSRPCARSRVLAQVQEFTAMEERRLEERLEEVHFEIDDHITLDMVKGDGRIERYIYPLLYLILRRHLRFIKLGGKYELSAQELVPAMESLRQVMKAAEERALTLSAVFRHSREQGQARLNTYAFGMFQHIASQGEHGDSRPEDNLLQFYYEGTYDDALNNEQCDAFASELGLKRVVADAGVLPPTKHHNAVCDACDCSISGERYACLQCVEAGLRTQIDLCHECITQTPTFGYLVHKSSHTLVRIPFHLHDKDKKLVYDMARKALEHVRRDVESEFEMSSKWLGRSYRAHGKSSKESHVCQSASCRHTITSPFWFCASCYANRPQKGVFACKETCITSHAGDHPNHIWILVKEEALRGEPSFLELQFKALEQNLGDRIKLLEQKLSDALTPN
ncbi:uncharacterized protein SCHCODRAFT_02660832 [Schizophyllum commune H4-8]|nr:uncharacterized protein SCHCODRAFT_02660832 [Schizophyllum commune H4-8]KAI5899169.1 hypothetical protein SCHCODRAFT_02660832 [Schizophyllum commune H4-8]